MSTQTKILIAIAAGVCLLFLVVCCGLVPMAIQRAVVTQVYPAAPPMPAVVPATMEQLLERYEKILREKAPKVLADMLPGLTDARIDELQKQGHFVLTPDLRALYRWHNGTPKTSTLRVFPELRFVPLDEALANRETLRDEARSNEFVARLLMSTLISHRDEWLGLIVDPGGEAHYYFDPGRSESEGSFFFTLTEDNEFTFYPAFRNFLASQIEGCEKGIYKFGSEGAETVDMEKSVEQSDRYGAPSR